MNSDQLAKFSKIAECQSITKAADLLYITPSALSHSLKNLEEELGCTLFIRQNKKMYLSGEGKQLLEYSNSVFRIIQEAESSFKNRHHITIGSINSNVGFVLQMYPHEDLDKIIIKSISGSDLFDKLICGEIDIAICDNYHLYKSYLLQSSEATNNKLKKTLLFRENLGVIVSPQHPIYNRKCLKIADLINTELCLRNDRPSLNEWIENIKNQTGFSFNVVSSLDNYSCEVMDDKLPFPELRDNSSVFSDKSTAGKKLNRRFVKLSDDCCSRDIYMWYMSRNEEKIQSVFDSIKQYYHHIS